MSIEDRAKAAAKTVVGKGQEVVGAVTGNSQDELAGKAKQAEGKVRDGVEDLKDKAADLGDKAKHTAEKVRDGLEDAKDSFVDKAKQLGTKVHDGIEQAKDELNK
jgi:uncharacterized protein YjbJ (UPF0337 family)